MKLGGFVWTFVTWDSKARVAWPKESILDMPQSSEEMKSSLARCWGVEKGSLHEQNPSHPLADRASSGGCSFARRHPSTEGRAVLRSANHGFASADQRGGKITDLCDRPAAVQVPITGLLEHDAQSRRRTCAGMAHCHAGVADATGEPVESIRVFLDSRMGDQFARAVIERSGPENLNSRISGNSAVQPVLRVSGT